MATVTPTPESAPKTSDAEQRECSTRDLLREIQEAVTKTKLQQEITGQKLTALEEHLKQVEEYDKKITTAADAYGKGIDAVCAGFNDLSETVEKNGSSYDCLVTKKEKDDVRKVLEDLRQRRKTLETCESDLKKAVIDKECELEHANAEVANEDEQLNGMLALLDDRSKELTALKDLIEVIGCSDTVSNKCRYAFYLDLEKRLDVACQSVHDYTCELVDQVKALDAARQRAREINGQVRALKDQLARVTKLYDDLVDDWQAELCRAVEGSAAALPADIAATCGVTTTPTESRTSTSTQHAVTPEQKEEDPKRPNHEHDEGSSTPTQAEGA